MLFTLLRDNKTENCKFNTKVVLLMHRHVAVDGADQQAFQEGLWLLIANYPFYRHAIDELLFARTPTAYAPCMLMR